MPSFGRTSGDPWTFAPAGQSGRGRLGALVALSSLGLPGEDDCATFEPLGLDEVEPPLQPLSPVQASSNSTHPAPETSPPAGPAPPAPGAAAAARSPGASDSFGFGGSGGGGGAASGLQSLRKMVSFTAFPAPGLGEGLSRHEPVAGNSGAATAVIGSFGAARSPGLPAGADGGLPAGGADQHVAVFDVASLMAGADEAEAAAGAAGGRASFLDPSKPAVRRLLPPLWHASQAAACEPPLRTVSGGLGLSNCSSGVVGATGAGGGGGTAGNSRTNSRAASLNSPGPDGGGVNKAAVDMRTLLLGLSAASPSSTSYCGDADISEAALALGLLLQSAPAAAGSAFGGLELAAAAGAAVQTTSAAGGAAAARAPSGPAVMVGTGGLFNSSSKRSLPPMDNSRLASTTGLTTGGGDFANAAAVEPAAGGASLLSRLAALSGPGAAGEAGAGSASGGGGGSGWSGGCCALYRAATEGLEYVQDSTAGRDRASSGSSSCGAVGAAGSYGAAGSTSAATSGGAAAVAGANGCEGQAAQQDLATASTGDGLLRRSEIATGALVPSSSSGGGGAGGTGNPGDSSASQLRLLGGLVGMPAAARMLSGTPAFHTAAGTGSSSGETAAGGGAVRVEAMRGRSFVMSARQRALLCLVPDGAAGGTAADGGDDNDNEDEEEGPQRNQQLAHQHRLTQAQLPLRDGLFRSSTQVTSSNAPAEGPRFAQRPPSTGVLGRSRGNGL